MRFLALRSLREHAIDLRGGGSECLSLLALRSGGVGSGGLRGGISMQLVPESDIPTAIAMAREAITHEPRCLNGKFLIIVSPLRSLCP